jgi:hypothetical protein
MDKLVNVITIEPANSGFGMYQTGNHNGESWELDNLLSSIKNNTAYNQIFLFELGQDDLPTDIEDIRGKINNEPQKIFAQVLDGELSYFGINVSIHTPA